MYLWHTEEGYFIQTSKESFTHEEDFVKNHDKSSQEYIAFTALKSLYELEGATDG
jgi:hypothetical protein